MHLPLIRTIVECMVLTAVVLLWGLCRVPRYVAWQASAADIRFLKSDVKSQLVGIVGRSAKYLKRP